jgi:hypothetical protein
VRAVELRADQTARAGGCNGAQRRSGLEHRGRVPDDQATHRRSAEGHADPDLARAPSDVVGEHAVEANRGQHDGQPREDAGEQGEEPLRGEAVLHLHPPRHVPPRRNCGSSSAMAPRSDGTTLLPAIAVRT